MVNAFCDHGELIVIKLKRERSETVLVDMHGRGTPPSKSQP